MKKLIILTIAILSIGAANAANLITNGDFESQAVTAGSYTNLAATNSLTAWRVFGNVDLLNSLVGFPENNVTTCVDLDGTALGRIEQDFATITTSNYFVSYRYACNSQCGHCGSTCIILDPVNKSIVKMNGIQWPPTLIPASVLSPTNRTAAVIGNFWVTNSFTFTATANTTRILFGAWGSWNSTYNTADPFFPSPDTNMITCGGILIDDVSVTAQ